MQIKSDCPNGQSDFFGKKQAELDFSEEKRKNCYMEKRGKRW